jgi:hypothetical protein
MTDWLKTAVLKTESAVLPTEPLQRLSCVVDLDVPLCHRVHSRHTRLCRPAPREISASCPRWTSHIDGLFVLAGAVLPSLMPPRNAKPVTALLFSKFAIEASLKIEHGWSIEAFTIEVLST